MQELPPAKPVPEASTPAPRPLKSTTPVQLKPAAKPKLVVSMPPAASSLGGHDRHLVLRPLDQILASDFELGPLAYRLADPELVDVLESLQNGLKAAKLPFESFSDNAASIARIMVPEDMLQGITSVRFAAPRIETEGIASVHIRVFALRNGNSSIGSTTEPPSRRAATGLAILVQEEAGTWQVEHFELDMEALATPMKRSQIWDPYYDARQY